MGPKEDCGRGRVAGGMSAAARARRLSEDAHIVVLERDAYVSFANCGMPYHIGGDIPDRDELLVQTPESLAAKPEPRCGSPTRSSPSTPRARSSRCATSGPAAYQLPYDKLVLATGAKPVQPSLPGIDSPLVHTLRNLGDMDRIKAVVDAGRGRAVVIGGGYIGIEMVEALRHRGWQVTLLEAADQVMGPLDPEMAQQVRPNWPATACNCTSARRPKVSPTPQCSPPTGSFPPTSSYWPSGSFRSPASPGSPVCTPPTAARSWWTPTK